MKLYDFHCNACGKDFEDLVQDVADARCPSCSARDVTKQISAFAVGGGRTGGDSIPSGPSGGGCGGGMCGGGMCGFN